jgi:hypothetical protein
MDAGSRGSRRLRASRAAWAMAGLASVLVWPAVTAPAALAASAWLAPLDISPVGSPASRPRIAVDPAGNAVAVWRHGIDGGEVKVQSAVRPAGAGWQAPVDISSPGLDISVGAFSLTRRAGRHRVRLPARVAGRVLRAGRYRLKATPTAARLTGAPSRTGFRVTR